MPAGGPQPPARPAPASGPGRLSRRTDGGPAQKLRELPDAQYGEATTFRNMQKQAPLSAAPSVPSSPAMGSGAEGAAGLPGFLDPTARPDEPITAGADAGDGPGADALGLPAQNADMRARLYVIYSRFPTEDLRELIEAME